MAYKTGAEYIKIFSENYGGYQLDDQVLIMANESVSDINTYKLIRGGEVVWTYSEDDTCDPRTSLIDALYELKYGTNHSSDITRDEIEGLFRRDEVSIRFKNETCHPSDWWTETLKK